MATLSSIPAKISPLSPWHIEFCENLKNEQKTSLLSLQRGFVEASAPFPIRGVAPLPSKSSVQSKHGIAQKSNGRKRETFETIVGSCISKAVAFSDRQFKAILKSFSDSSAEKSTSSRDVRCQNAGKTYSDGPENNDNGVGGGDGGGNEGGGGGSENGSGSQGSANGKSGGVMGANWWRRRCKQCSTRGRSVLIRVANQRQIYDHATSDNSNLWMLWEVVERMLHPGIAPVSIGLIIRPAVELIQLFSVIMFYFDSLVLQILAGYSVLASAGLLLLLFILFQMMRSADDDLEFKKE